MLKSTILIVDDEPGVRTALSGVLRDEGYTVDAVSSGEECLERLTRSAVDLIVLETAHDPANRLVRIVVADDGPGIPPAEREKLFLPYYSTKRRGSGLGLAIVRRIVAEHGGNVEVSDNVPRGTRFTIELPC